MALASRSGIARPKFTTERGENIFPDAEELWWLTDVAKRLAKEEAKVAGDEDGPVDGSSADECALDGASGEEAEIETTDIEIDDDDDGGEELTWCIFKL